MLETWAEVTLLLMLTPQPCAFLQVTDTLLSPAPCPGFWEALLQAGIMARRSADPLPLGRPAFPINELQIYSFISSHDSYAFHLVNFISWIMTLGSVGTPSEWGSHHPCVCLSVLSTVDFPDGSE